MNAMTAGELIEWLQKFDAKTPVLISCNWEYEYPLQLQLCKLMTDEHDNAQYITLGDDD